MMAQAITMGDEFHQRNIAASSLLLRTLSPVIAGLDRPEAEIIEDAAIPERERSVLPLSGDGLRKAVMVRRQ